jgi:hypothetical protein
MESAYYAVRRTREIILHEGPSYTGLCVALRLERFEEKTSWISEHLGLDNHDIRNICPNDLHGKSSHRSNFTKPLYLLCIDHRVYEIHKMIMRLS